MCKTLLLQIFPLEPTNTYSQVLFQEIYASSILGCFACKCNVFFLDFPNNITPHNHIGEKVSYFNVLMIQMGSLFKCGFCLADQNMS